MKYMVTLKSVGSYFFGGEVTLGDGTTQNYFVKSNLLPQPSALFGLMRYELLRQNNLLSYNPKDKYKLSQVQELIGENGFSLQQPASQSESTAHSSKQTWGVIQSISPVFLYHPKTDCYYTVERVDRKAKMSCTLDEKDYPALSVDREEMKDSRCSYFPDEESVAVQSVPDFQEKNYDYSTYWCDAKGDRLTLKGDIFTLTEKIGITKNGRKKNEKDAFFKQEMVQLNPALRMAFMVEIKDDYSLQEGESWVFLGGNRSMFQMKIQPPSDPEFDFRIHFKDLHVDGSLLALGDAYLPDESRKTCPFIWGISMPFRYMENATSNGHSWRKPKKSVLYNLQQRGSVIYAGEEQLKQLKELPFQHLGLNYFV